MGWSGRLLPRQQAKLARGAKDKEHAMSQTPNTAIAVIGIDIGKNSFHVVATMRAAPSCCGKTNPAIRSGPPSSRCSCIVRAISSNGSSTRSSNADVSRPDMTSSQPTIWHSSNSHQSEFGTALMSPRPGRALRPPAPALRVRSARRHARRALSPLRRQGGAVRSRRREGHGRVAR